MTIKSYLRRTVFAAFTGLSLVGLATGATMVVAGPTSAQAQVSDEFQAALEPYGEWRQHPRWGLIWVPDGRPRGWQPYTVGHWVYTDDWGWFWVSDEDEADWGWVTYHYGRWIHDRGAGWFWVPGDEWAPAWVNWRRGDTVVGWAPLPPDDVVYEYDDNPDTWVFVEPRYMAAPRLRTYFVPQQRRDFVLRSTVMVNRSFSANRQGLRIAVNPGISPAVIGAASRSAIPTFRVRPRVLASTQGVSGAVAVRPEDLRRRGEPRNAGPSPAITVQKTTTLIQPAASVPKPQPLGKEERGRLGTHPPRAAQGGAGGSVVLPQQQQQGPVTPAPVGAPPAPGTPLAPRPAPSTPTLQSPPGGAPTRSEPPRSGPREERRDQGAPATATPAPRTGEPPPQVRPERPVTPQTPPPPPPAQNRQSPPPPPVVHQPAPPPPPAVHAPPPPPPPQLPAARPAAPPPPPPPAARAPPPPPPAAAKPAAPAKPEEKKPEVPK